MDVVEERLRQAEGHLAYWRDQFAAAGRQVAMWEGAVEALRGAVEEMAAAAMGDETFGEDDVARLKGEEKG